MFPGPTAYDLLGDLGSALGYLAEVVEFLPQGVQNSLTDGRITVYDEVFWSGEKRDPAAQAAIAANHLAELLDHLRAASLAADAAQVALNGQGYRTSSEEALR